MKYIRTKDSIVKHPHPKAEVFTFRYDVVKSADTIEELCDEFVAMIRVNDDRTFEMEDNLTQLMFVVKDAELEDFIENIYGAIWTDKGLIYVAKMNEKGVLELL